MPAWRPRLVQGAAQAIAPHVTTVKQVIEDWRHLRDGSLKRKFSILLDDPVRVPTARGAAIVMRDVVQTWDEWSASLCDQAAKQRFRVRLRVRETAWGLELVMVTRQRVRTHGG